MTDHTTTSPQTVRAQYLAGRGILEATIKAYGFYAESCQPHEWKYDTFGIDGHRATRIRRKPINGQDKSVWVPGLKAQGDHVFYLPDAPEVMREIVSHTTDQEPVLFQARTVWVVEGEVDLWTIHSALGYDAFIPAPALKHHTGVWTHADILWLRDELGIRRLFSVPDLDSAGKKRAFNLARACDGVDGVHLDTRILQAEDDKFDLNKLWQQVGFERQRFIDGVLAARRLTIKDVYTWSGEDYLPLPGPPHAWGGSQGGEADEVAAKIAAHLGVKRFKGNGWSDNFNCIFHDDHTPSAAVHEQGNYYCQGCQIKKTRNEMAAHFGIALVPQTPVDTSGLLVAPARQLAPAPVKETAPTTDQWLVVLKDEATKNYDRSLDGALPGLRPPVELPFAFMHHLGGYAHILPRGQIMHISSDSGMGKSQLVRAFARAKQSDGAGGIAWLSEHLEGSRDTLAGRRIVAQEVQTLGGMTEYRYNQVQLHYSDPERYRHYAPTDVELAAARAQTAAIRQRLGEIVYIRRKPFFAVHLHETVERAVALLDKKGYDPEYLIVDYLQRLPLGTRNETGQSWAEVVAQEMKLVCEEFSLVGVLVTQVTQEGSEAMKDQKPFRAIWMQYLRNFTANLLLMFAPVPQVPGQNRQARYQVLKNSGGKVMAEEATIPWRPERLDFDISAQNGVARAPRRVQNPFSILAGRDD